MRRKFSVLHLCIIVSACTLALLCLLVHTYLNSYAYKWQQVQDDLTYLTESFLSCDKVTERVVNNLYENRKEMINYSSNQGLAKIVGFVNEGIGDAYKFTWDDDLKAYVSAKADPWGGKYLLTDYPIKKLADDFYTQEDSTVPVIGVSLWNTSTRTGDNAYSKYTPIVVSKNDVGSCILYGGGIVQYKYHGFDSIPFENWIILLR